jgi:hypothetical protein
MVFCACAAQLTSEVFLRVTNSMKVLYNSSVRVGSLALLCSVT